MKSTGSYSFYSQDLNKSKYDDFVRKGEAIRDFKNLLSEHVCENFHVLMNQSKFDWVKSFGTTDSEFNTTDLIRGNELQKAVADVYDSYETKFSQVQSKISFQIQKSFQIAKYKRNTGSKLKGSVRSTELKRKSTRLTKVMTYMARYGHPEIITYIETAFDKADKNKQAFYSDIIKFCEQYGLERLLTLALKKRQRVLNQYQKPIVFKSLSYRSAIQSVAPLIQNNSGKTNAFLVIPGMLGRKMVVPTSFNINHHGHLNQYKTKEYTVVIELNRIRFVVTKDVEREYSTGKSNFIGVDTNVKHNLFSTSVGKEIDFDRSMFQGYISFLKKYQPKTATKGELKQFKLWQERMQCELKRKASELVDLAIQNGKDHIVMEDLSVMGRSFARSDDFEGFKYSRLTKLLNLSNLKNIVRSICQKKGVQLTLIHSHYTSQACPCCGHISKENRQSQEEFKCVVCGHSTNADLNSSINIELFGRQEVLDRLMLKEDSSSWLVPKVLRKETIKNYREDIITTDAFQRNRQQLFSNLSEFIGS